MHPFLIIKEPDLLKVILFLAAVCLGMPRLSKSKVFINRTFQKVFYHLCIFVFVISLGLLFSILLLVLFVPDAYNFLEIAFTFSVILFFFLAAIACATVIIVFLQEIKGSRQYYRSQEKISLHGNWSFLNNIAKEDIPALLFAIKKSLSNNAILTSAEAKALSDFTETMIARNRKQIQFNLLHCASGDEDASLSMQFKGIRKKSLWNLCGLILLQIVWMVFLVLFQDFLSLLLTSTFLYLVLLLFMLKACFRSQKKLRKLQNEYVQKHILNYFSNMSKPLEKNEGPN